jgi:uncharacterized protein (TIGR02145 family)
MKTKVLLAVLATALMLSTSAQKSVIELTFTATYYDQYVPLDSILIENLTQGGDTILYYPDTMLVLDIGTNIQSPKTLPQEVFLLTQNYPNPFSEKTTFGVLLLEEDKLHLTLSEPGGKQLTNYHNTLSPGFHVFTVYSDDWKVIMLSATFRNVTKTIKLVNVNENNSQGCRIEYNGKNDNPGHYKYQQEISDFIFQLGDALRYTAYAKTPDTVNGSDVIEDSPQGNQLYHFEILEGIPCPGIPWVSYEGQNYNTVMIGSQCWFKENLNVGIMIPGTQDMSNDSVIEKYCYNNLEDKCTIYGGFYQWNEMMQYTTTQGAQGICPPNWHIPTDAELIVLEGTVDSMYGIYDPEWNGVGFRGFDAGSNLKTTTNWYSVGNGTDLFGFSGMPAGNRYIDGSFINYRFGGIWWTSTEFNSGHAWFRMLSYNYQEVWREYYEEGYGYSVRCLKDE